MTSLMPLETLYEVKSDQDRAPDLPFPPELAHLYGRLSFPAHPDHPYVIGNLVTTLDGVVSLNVPGHAGGGDISGFNQHDHMVMGVLRAVSDAIIVGAGTLRDAPYHRWTAEYIYPALADAYITLRSTLKKSEPPLNVIVTARGEIDLSRPVFRSGEVPVLIVTTKQGERRIRGEQPLPPAVQIATVPQREQTVSARAIFKAVQRVRPSEIILVEGGPQLIGDFFAEHCLDEQFLTLAPQIAGRDNTTQRPGLVSGKLFAPDHPLWGTLISVKRADNHLFLRYAFSGNKES
ncbi:MAG TPA: dihydrofolate reductase family protein [Ktedonobacteraceae bacterium]|nr:dihydrofolate reductase family protein [Ktedonobacteraceae bacterium]